MDNIFTVSETEFDMIILLSTLRYRPHSNNFQENGRTNEKKYARFYILFAPNTTYYRHKASYISQGIEDYFITYVVTKSIVIFLGSFAITIG